MKNLYQETKLLYNVLGKQTFYNVTNLNVFKVNKMIQLQYKYTYEYIPNFYLTSL